ncbi:MAG: Uncharacterized protein JWR13_419 [Mycobacterium sp.]|jgi:hypothetical protein|nr:Uncharacterized protein [Mycobacterium sp.]MDT5311174.1 hypothetical protein [Mycobacterium sp.]
MYHRKSGWKWLAAIASTIGLAFATVAPGHADPPGDVPANPFPEMGHVLAWYDKFEPDQLFIADHPGVWFLSPSGLTCGIWDRGSFGCTGDIPGLPPGSNHIAWFNGNRSVHYGWTAAIQFPPGQPNLTLPPRSYVTYNSTTCAIEPDSTLYCGHGEFKFLINATGTIFKGYDEPSTRVCLSYGSC